MSLVTNLQTAFTRVATECKALRVLINGNAVDLSGLTTSVKTSLLAAINELDAAIDGLAAGGSATNLDALTDVAITTPATGHVLRHNGTLFVNALGTTFFEVAGAAAAAQAASQPASANLTSLAGVASSVTGRGVLAAADAAALTALLNAATSSIAGIVQLATTVEATTGTNTTKAVTPAGVAAAIAALVASAPSTLDTLNELATALGNDPNFATTITTSIATKQAGDATLTALAAVVTAANKLIYATGVDTFATTDLTSFARTILDDGDQATVQATIGVYSTAQIGDPTTDFAAGFVAGLV